MDKAAQAYLPTDDLGDATISAVLTQVAAQYHTSALLMLGVEKIIELLEERKLK